MSNAHQMMIPTPGPVKLAKRNPKRIVSVCKVHPSDRRAVPVTIAVCETEGDAERIVQCVNAHDKLVASVLDLMALCDGWNSDTGAPARAQAILAKVGAHKPAAKLER